MMQETSRKKTKQITQ